MRNWHYLFEERILGRGLSYTDEVEIVFRDDEKVKAIVSGTEDYNVEITFDRGRVDGMHCSCPYFSTGNCKHLAALLFVLEDEKETVIVMEDFTELFDSLDCEDLRDFLFEELKANPKLLNKFKLKFSDSIDSAYYKNKLTSICFADHNRYLINDFLCNDMRFLLDRKEYGLVLDLLDEVFPYIRDWWNCWEDYDGDGNMEELEGIAKALALSEVHGDVFEWLEDLIWAIPTDDHMDGLIRLYLTQFTSADELKEKERLADKLFEKTQDVKWVMIKIDLMGQLDYSSDEIIEFRMQHKDYEEIMKQCIASSSGAEREALLKEAIAKFRYPQSYDLQLKDHYRDCADVDNYLRQLERMVFEYPDVDYYVEFRDNFNGDWTRKRREIFDNYADKGWFLNECYAAEGMYDLLVENIRNRWDLDQYRDVLAENYSDEVIEKYSEIAVGKAEKSGPLKHYEEIADILKIIYDLPGGKKRAVEIAEGFKVKYRRRPRMLQALRKAGF